MMRAFELEYSAYTSNTLRYFQILKEIFKATRVSYFIDVSSAEKDFQTLETIIQNRRTVKDYDGREIPEKTILELLSLGIWAPNHHMTEPWTFRVLTQSGIKNWHHFLETKLSADEKALTAKVFKKLSGIGAIVYVTSKRNENSTVDLENYAATCCAIEHILLGATARDIRSYWSTSKVFADKNTLDFLKVADSEKFVGALWLGYGELPEPKARKSVEEKTIWIK